MKTKKENYKTLTMEEVKEHISNGQCLNEVIPNNIVPCKLYIDIETEPTYEITEKSFLQYREKLMECIGDFIKGINLFIGGTLTMDDIALCGYDLQTAKKYTKISHHIVIPRLITNIYTIKNHILKDCMDFPGEFQFDKEPYHSSNQQFRLPMCPKEKEDRILHILTKHKLDDFILTNITEDPNNIHFTQQMTVSPYEHTSFNASDDVMEAIKNKLDSIGIPNYHINGKDIEYDHGSFECPIHHHIHDRYNLCINQTDKGDYYLGCYKSGKGDAVLLYKKKQDVTREEKTEEVDSDSDQEEEIKSMEEKFKKIDSDREKHKSVFDTDIKEDDSFSTFIQKTLVRFGVIGDYLTFLTKYILSCSKNGKGSNLDYLYQAICHKIKNYAIQHKVEDDNRLYVFQKDTGIWIREYDDGFFRRNILKTQQLMMKIVYLAGEYPNYDAELFKNIGKAGFRLLDISPQNNQIRYFKDDPYQIISTREVPWNNNPFLFAFKDGVFDLKTMSFRPALKTEYINFTTKHTYKEFNKIDKEAIKKINDLFLSIFPDQQEREFALRANALGLCGITKQNFIVSIGDGGNGKGILMNLRKDLLDCYHSVMSIDWFMDTKHGVRAGAPDEELSALEGKRYVDIDEPKKETSNGVSLRVNKLKSLTSGNTISTRGMYEKKKEFKLQALFNFSTNFPINLPQDDGGILRRFINMTHRVKFIDKLENKNKHNCRYSTHFAVKKDNIDKFSEDELLACFHILSQSINWNKLEESVEQELNIPSSFQVDTSQYLDSMDGMPAFLNKFLTQTVDKEHRVYLKELHSTWLEHKTGSKAYSQNALKEHLIKIGIKVYRNGNIFFIKGYKIDDGTEEVPISEMNNIECLIKDKLGN